MSIKQHAENALKNMQAERDRELAIARERVTREKIVPNNQEVDSAMAKAMEEITKQRDEAISQVQAQFSDNRTALIEEAARQKNTFAERVMAEETAVINAKYDSAEADLAAIIEKYSEA